MQQDEFDASTLDALTDAVLLGWRACRDYPDLDERDGVEVPEVLTRAAKARGWKRPSSIRPSSCFGGGRT